MPTLCWDMGNAIPAAGQSPRASHGALAVAPLARLFPVLLPPVLSSRVLFPG